MKHMTWMLAFGLVSFSPYALAVEENFCDPVATPELCQDDVVNVRFDGDPLTSEKQNVKVNDDIAVTITINVVTAGISGFSYGVEHDPTYLNLPAVVPTIVTTDPTYPTNRGFPAWPAVRPPAAHCSRRRPRTDLRGRPPGCRAGSSPGESGR